MITKITMTTTIIISVLILLLLLSSRISLNTNSFAIQICLFCKPIFTKRILSWLPIISITLWRRVKSISKLKHMIEINFKNKSILYRWYYDKPYEKQVYHDIF